MLIHPERAEICVGRLICGRLAGKVS
jgi:hypothetical protein